MTTMKAPKKRRWGPFLLYFMLPSLVSKMIYPSRDAALMWDICLVAYGAALLVWAQKFPYLRDLPSVKGWRVWGGFVFVVNTALVGYVMTQPSPPNGPWTAFATWSDGTGLTSQWFIDADALETVGARRAAWVKFEYNMPFRGSDNKVVTSAVVKMLIDCQQQTMGTLYEDDFTNSNLSGAVTHSVQTTPDEVQMQPVTDQNFYLWKQNVCQRT